MKICHVTSVHPRFDIRIFHKECRSLIKAGLEVFLVVADGQNDEVHEGIHVIDAGARPSSRVKRMISTPRMVLEEAIKVDAEIYHLHDPELIPAGLKLVRLGKQVIFDAHEDLPKQVLAKPYIPGLFKPLVSAAVALAERLLLRKYSAIVCATDVIRRKFAGVSPLVKAVNNFPMLAEISRLPSSASRPQPRPAEDGDAPVFCYVGAISKMRGIVPLVQSLEHTRTSVYLEIAGNFINNDTMMETSKLAGWSKVRHRGFLGREEILELLSGAVAGLVTLLPLPNYREALPIKMFEYMGAGIPVIASDFPLWREIIEDADCGVCVNPERPEEIADAMDYLVDNPGEASRMGENGRKAVLSMYNWEQEEQELLSVYNQLSDTIQSKKVS